MGKHRPKNEMDKCKVCRRPSKKMGLWKNGKQKYSVYCNSHHSELTASGKRRKNKTFKKSQEFLNGKMPYQKFKEDKCVSCGFLPVNECQLDVDHIDGNHENHDPKNLQTLCANCHRLKTFLNGDGIFG